MFAYMDKCGQKGTNIAPKIAPNFLNIDFAIFSAFFMRHGLIIVQLDLLAKLSNSNIFFPRLKMLIVELAMLVNVLADYSFHGFSYK